MRCSFSQTLDTEEEETSAPPPHVTPRRRRRKDLPSAQSDVSLCLTLLCIAFLSTRASYDQLMWSFTTPNLVPTLLQQMPAPSPSFSLPAWLLSSPRAFRLRSRLGRSAPPHSSIPPGFPAQAVPGSGAGWKCGRKKSS
ncbi:hypothetical protein CORC01_11683 [Colletotrichum orchidophilum]|uniref:Uncharacterized protein n=1 Tax=Colletotrichum orchidophilum TaxID=1209926 RepID=A0A1G4AV76_9PEZI|nr:uncharacterized protein CORC01_11683 [Colletotrichum orchidophilum]OHE93044.1 hypothetical protein CORC01_11683 [Colletotrichum orchidophilum]